MLFLAENWLLLPKADWIRVLAEGAGLLAIAIFDQIQKSQNRRLWKEE